MPSEKAQLISSASVTAFFLAASVWTRPYVENIEDWLDIAGRIFLLATLGVGIALMGDDNDDSGGQVVCDVILAVIVLASNALFVFVLNPRKLLRGVVKAARETRVELLANECGQPHPSYCKEENLIECVAPQ